MENEDKICEVNRFLLRVVSFRLEKFTNTNFLCLNICKITYLEQAEITQMALFSKVGCCALCHQALPMKYYHSTVLLT